MTSQLNTSHLGSGCDKNILNFQAFIVCFHSLNYSYIGHDLIWLLSAWAEFTTLHYPSILRRGLDKPFDLASFFFLPNFFFLCVCFVFLGPHPPAYGSSQARGLIGAAAASLHRSSLQRRILTYCVSPGIEPATSWFLVRFISVALLWELLFLPNFYGTLGLWKPKMTVILLLCSVPSPFILKEFPRTQSSSYMYPLGLI